MSELADAMTSLAPGVYELDAGTYVCNKALPMPLGSFWLRGKGRGATTLLFPNDLGAGTYALPWNGISDNGHRVKISNLTLQGPEVTTTLGAHPAQMHGIQWGPSWTLEDCLVGGFNSGVVVWGDHQTMRDCVIQHCYYGLDYADSPPQSGDQSLYSIILTGQMYASVHVGANQPIDGNLWERVHLGFCPYGIRATGVGANVVMDDSVLASMSFEQIGNAAVWDSRTGGQQTCVNSTWLHVGFSWGNPTYTYGGEARDFCIKTPGQASGDFQNSIVHQGLHPFTAGTTGIWSQSSPVNAGAKDFTVA